MPNNMVLVQALKRMLRVQCVTYADVACALTVSEATIKRWFSRGGFTLQRFEQICDLAGTTIGDLARASELTAHAVRHLSVEQELTMVRNKKLLLTAMCALNRMTLEGIVDRYQITKAETIHLLLQLDRMGLLDLLPENRIRLRAAHTFDWLPAGPVRKFLRVRVQTDYFQTDFDRPDETLVIVNTMLTPDARIQLHEKLRQLVLEFSAAPEPTRGQEMAGLCPITLVAALRPWELMEFRELRRRR